MKPPASPARPTRRLPISTSPEVRSGEPSVTGPRVPVSSRFVNLNSLL